MQERGVRGLVTHSSMEYLDVGSRRNSSLIFVICTRGNEIIC